MMVERKGVYGWLGNTLQYQSGIVIAGVVIVTILLLVPFFIMEPKESASDNPIDNEIVQLSDHIEDTFDEEVLWIGYIIEARDGDMLTRKNLAEVYEREQALKDSDLSKYLYNLYDEAAQMAVEGVYTLADAVNEGLQRQSGGTLDLFSEEVTDEQVKAIVRFIMNSPAAEHFHENLSALYDEQACTSPAITLPVLSKDEAVLIDYLDENTLPAEATVGEKAYAREEYALEMQKIMRGDEVENEVWGIAIDLEHEIEEESMIGGAMLFVAMILMAILLLVIFRSVIIMVLTVGGLAMLIVWMMGLSNLIGLKSSLIIDIILPVAIVVLGVDYGIQALFRYREQRAAGDEPRTALGNSTSRVGRALVLAMFTTIVAFLSNAMAEIESVIGFAIAAAVAIFASFILLGLFVPTITMKWREWRSKGGPAKLPAGAGSRVIWLGNAVSAVSDRWKLWIPLVLVITGLAAWGWTNVETKFDAADALKGDSDFVVSLDKWDIHGADKGGEPSLLYFEGDLTQIEAIEAMHKTIDQMNREGEEHYVGNDPVTGEANASSLLLDMLEALLNNDYAQAQIETSAGIQITDTDNDGIPDTPEQLRAIYDYVIANGLPEDESTLRYRPKQIGEDFVELKSGKYATIMLIGVPGTREQSVVRFAQEQLDQDMEIALSGVDSITKYGITGSGHVRVVQFDAIADALTSSLIIAIAAVLAILLAIFRSVRYAAITIIPVLLVATWLYGFMYLADYSLNMLTATIAAISIGVGIDFSIHFTERFREELNNGLDKRSAIVKTAQSTGFALFCTALTTVLGFCVIALAPMPMFAIFGRITAIMIALSLFMALFVLPSLLYVFATEPTNSNK